MLAGASSRQVSHCMKEEKWKRNNKYERRKGKGKIKISNESQKNEKRNVLPGRESNPGLPRDRRRYLPLYYRGLTDTSKLVWVEEQARAQGVRVCSVAASIAIEAATLHTYTRTP